MNSLKSHFLSDLHLLSRRSTGLEFGPSILAAARESHTMILGGDIFDFKWSTFRSLDESIEQSIRWLDALTESNPDCSFHYLLGNHDSHPHFVHELEQFANRQPRLKYHRHVLRIGECVFLHGDIVDSEPTDASLEERRKLFEAVTPPRPYAHWLYDLVVQTRLHRVALHAAIRQKRVLRKLHHYLTAQGLNPQNGVRDVYFGHTHRIMDDVPYEGLIFHNGGAAIRGLPFQIIETRLP